MTHSDIKKIRQQYSNGIDETVLADKYGVSRQTINNIVLNKIHKDSSYDADKIAVRRELQREISKMFSTAKEKRRVINQQTKEKLSLLQQVENLINEGIFNGKK